MQRFFFQTAAHVFLSAYVISGVLLEVGHTHAERLAVNGIRGVANYECGVREQRACSPQKPTCPACLQILLSVALDPQPVPHSNPAAPRPLLTAAPDDPTLLPETSLVVERGPPCVHNYPIYRSAVAHLPC